MSPSDGVMLRPARAGDYGWALERHEILIPAQFGWNARHAADIAEILAAFIRSEDARERFWIAERKPDGARLGCVGLARPGEREGRLRVLWVEPDARGSGLGRRLVDACLEEARAQGCREVVLWTMDVLHAARRIYADVGFVKTAEAPHADYGVPLMSETWRLEF